jgi:hypothetical protein
MSEFQFLQSTVIETICPSVLFSLLLGFWALKEGKVSCHVTMLVLIYIGMYRADRSLVVLVAEQKTLLLDVVLPLIVGITPEFTEFGHLERWESN